MKRVRALKPKQRGRSPSVFVPDPKIRANDRATPYPEIVRERLPAGIRKPVPYQQLVRTGTQKKYPMVPDDFEYWGDIAVNQEETIIEEDSKGSVVSDDSLYRDPTPLFQRQSAPSRGIDSTLGESIESFDTPIASCEPIQSPYAKPATQSPIFVLEDNIDHSDQCVTFSSQEIQHRAAQTSPTPGPSCRVQRADIAAKRYEYKKASPRSCSPNTACNELNQIRRENPDLCRNLHDGDLIPLVMQIIDRTNRARQE